MNKILVSVIITTYKRKSDILSKAIDSILNQDYKNLELFVVDDSPNDYEFRTEVEEYCNSINDPRFNYIKQSKNMGACVARNTGIMKSKGKYVCFLDDDDIYLPNKIKKMVSAIEEDDDIVLVYSDIAMYKNNKLHHKFSDIQKPHDGFVYDKIMETNFIGPTSIALLRKDALEKVGMFDPEMEASQDWDVWIRISKIGKVKYVDEVLFNYYSDCGMSKDRISNDTSRRIRALKHLNEKNIEYLNGNSKVFAARLEYLLRLYIMNNDLKNAIKTYFDIIRKRPLSVIKNLILIKAFGRIFIKKSI